VTLRFVDFSSNEPIGEGLEFRGNVMKQGAAATPNADAPVLAFQKEGDCAFTLSTTPAVSDDEVLSVAIVKAPYATGTWMLAGKVLKDSDKLKKSTDEPIALVSR